MHKTAEVPSHMAARFCRLWYDERYNCAGRFEVLYSLRSYYHANPGTCDWAGRLYISRLLENYRIG